jgi:flagellar hook-length control protein FliK
VDVTNVGKGNNDLGVDKLKNVQENGGNVVQFVTHQYETLTAKPEFLGVYESVSLPLAGQGNVQVQMVQSESQPSFNFNADTNEALFTITDAKGAKNVGNFARAVAENECLEQVDRAEFIQRLVKAAKLAQLQGHSALKMTLTPPNMGNLRVELVMKGKVLHTSFEVESQSTKELVVSNLGNLKEALQSEGINIGRFDVLMRDGYQGTTEGDTSAENQDFGSNSSYFASEDKSNQTMQDRKNHSAGIGLQLVDLFA